MINNVDALLEDFIAVARLSGFKTDTSNIRHDLWQAPHSPKQLPNHAQAVYIFSLPSFENKVLKIGKAGPNTKARFLSQHYNPNSSPSNLAKSLMKSTIIWKELKIQKPIDQQIGVWIRNNADRDNFYIDMSLGNYYLSLLEIFLQCRFTPVFEG